MKHVTLVRKIYIKNAVSKQEGFTFVEMLICVAIIAVVSAQVLVSFSGLKDASTLERAAQELALNIRRAQGMALAVTPVNLGGMLKIPQSVALRLSSRSGNNISYFFFSDVTPDGKYTDNTEQIEPIINLPGKIYISAISGTVPANPEAHVIFYTPEATLALTNFNGVTILNFIDITFKGVSGATKIVRVQMGGQVSVR